MHYGQHAVLELESEMSKKGSFDMIMKNMDADRATKILAKSLYRELRGNGFSNKDIVNFSKEMVECIAREVNEEPSAEVSSEKDRLLIG